MSKEKPTVDAANHSKRPADASPSDAANRGLSVKERLDALVTRYNAFGKITAEGILGKADVIAEAHKEFGSVVIGDLYKLIQFPEDGSTTRKFLAIAKQRTRFEPVLHKLPNTWTTIAALAFLKPEQFAMLLAKDVIHPLATWATISIHLPKKPTKAKAKAEEPTALIAVNIRSVGVTRRAAFAERLVNLAEEFELELKEEDRATLEAFLVSNETVEEHAVEKGANDTRVPNGTPEEPKP